ncbi:molybdate ABC transporter substrate-binding protein [Romboutsia sp.]|uniref:molybdate ABC transporter substrate-binding protein n=1 Tax=Romboutsia sp. TaxID=1965302 RepID=UPI003F31ED38
MKKLGRTVVLLSVLSLLVVGCSKPQDKLELNISAASSLKEAMVKLVEEYKNTNENINLVVNYGSSGSLQQQIEQGAPCDVFISAGKKQMDALKEGGLLLNDTYKNLVENELVLIAPKDSRLTNIEDLKSDKVKHIAVGEPKSVPAGKYADEVLTNLKLKDSIKDKLVFAKDVKEVLAWTTSGNAELGFVYYSDILNNDKIKVIEKIAKDSHSPIIYPVAITKDSKKSEEAKKFEDFLLSDKGQDILKEFGYKSVK